MKTFFVVCLLALAATQVNCLPPSLPPPARAGLHKTRSRPLALGAGRSRQPASTPASLPPTDVPALCMQASARHLTNYYFYPVEGLVDTEGELYLDNNGGSQLCCTSASAARPHQLHVRWCGALLPSSRHRPLQTLPLGRHRPCT